MFQGYFCLVNETPGFDGRVIFDKTMITSTSPSWRALPSAPAMVAHDSLHFPYHPYCVILTSVTGWRNELGRVSIVRTGKGIPEALDESLKLIGGLQRFVGRSDNIMLKPNLNGADVYTNKVLVGALIERLLDLGVRRVFIGESTFGNARNTDMFFQKTGYKDLAKRYGIDLVNLNASDVIEATVENPLVLEKIHIARDVYEADKVINIPNMKVHYATGVSLSLKNLKGLLVGEEKRHFHEIGLDNAIVDLCNTIKVNLNIVDCISCMESMGPHGGDVVDLNLLIAGQKSAEVDYIGCQVMGYDISEVKHLQQYVEMNGIDLSEIDVEGVRLEDAIHPLKKVSMESIIPEEITLHDSNACSTCMNAFLISCRFLQGKASKPVDVCLGSLAEDFVRSDGGVSVAFGNCCVKNMDADHKIIGCPPYPFALGEVLKDILE